MNQPKIITIASYNSPVEAEIALSLLESFGVVAQLLHSDAATTLNYLNPGQQTVKLIVNEQDAARAREILSAQFDRQEAEKGYAAERGHKGHR